MLRTHRQIMPSGCYIDELEGQRRELEARRALLEERFKLRLATAQVIAALVKANAGFAVAAYYTRA